MPGSQRIDNIIDEQAVNAQIKNLIDQLQNAAKVIKDFPQVVLNYKESGSAADLRKNTDALAEANGKAVKTFDDLTLSVNQYQNILSQNAQAQAKMNASQSEAGKALASTREQLRQQNLETKNSTIVNQAAEGSIQQMRAQLSLLTSQYDKMSAAQRTSPEGNALQQQINGQVEALKQLEAETGRYQRNVGNYTGAVQILEKSLQEVKAMIDQMTQSGQGNSEAVDKLNKEYALLEQLVGRQAEGFTSLSREVMMTGKQLETMAAEGMQNTEAFKQLQQSFIGAKQELKEFQLNQQLLTSPKAGLQALTLTAKALGGTYALAAGGAALFADGNEKVEKELNKLVAIMTVLQGLNEVHEFMEKKGAIATIFRTAAEKVKSFVLTGSTKATVENTVATNINTESNEVSAVAITATGTAAKVATGAMIGLRTILMASGIGIILLLLPALAAAMDKASEKSKEMGDSSKKTSDAEKDLAEKLKLTREAVEHSSDAYVEATKNLYDVRNALDLAKEGVISKKQAVDVYNESVGKAMGQVKSLKEVEDKLSDPQAVKAYVDMMMFKAAANYALEEAAKKAYEAEKINQYQLSQPKQEETVSTMPTSHQVAQDQGKKMATAFTEGTKKGFQKESSNLENIANEFQQKINSLAGKFKFNPLNNSDNGVEKKPKASRDTTNDELKSEEDLLKAKSELSKLELEEDAKKMQSIFDNEKNGFVQRLNAYNHYILDKKQLDKIAEEEELSEINIKLKKIAEIENKPSGKQTVEEKKLLLEKETLLVQEETITKKHLFNIEDINREAAGKIKVLWEKQGENMKKAMVGEVADIKVDKIVASVTEETKALDALNQKLKDGKISAEEYAKEHEKITDKATLDKLKAEYDEVESLIGLYKMFGLDTRDLKLKEAEIHQQIEEKKTKVTETELKKREQAEKKSSDAWKDIEKRGAEAAKELFKNIIEGTYEKQLNKIQEQIDANTKLKDAEVQRINSSTLSETDKAAKLAQLQAASQAREDQLNAKKKAENLKKAKFDREMAIMEVVINTAMAIARAVAEFPETGGMPFVAIDAAIGAAQIGAILAKPLPKYAEGKKENDSYSGPAIVGDGGRQELIVRKSGEVELTPSVPTLTTVEKGDIIYPDISKFTKGLIPYDEVNKVLLGMMLNHTASHINNDVTGKKINELKEVIMWQTNELIKASGKQKAPKVIINNNGDWHNYIQRQVFD